MMLSRRRPAAHQKLPQISNDEEFFMRVLSKETSAASTPSFRIYYGVSAAGAVPFTWESQPGTPKHAASPSALPPLTPPPSYYFISPNNPSSKSPKLTKPNMLHSMLPRLAGAAPPKKPQPPSPSFSSSSTASSSLSSRCHRRGGGGHFSSPVSSFSSNSKSGDEEGLSPSSTLSLRQRSHGAGGKSGCYSMFVMKNVLLSIVGHGSA